MEYNDSKMNIRIVLFGLWTAIISLFHYLDVNAFNNMSYVIIGDIMNVPIDELSDIKKFFFFIIPDIILIIPIFMIISNLFINKMIIIWINIIGGFFYVLLIIGKTIYVIMLYYPAYKIDLRYGIIYGIIEISVSMLLIVVSIKWFKKYNKK
ncbi:MAG: hypothetical protein LBV17_05070 [Treponema sp.]|jgi:hypothetical protein|nr:hypothetical protein [Treponema sp.]